MLDNCEQVIEVVAGLAHRILRETVETHLLITSREPLRIAGEHVHRLAPLECPPVKVDITAGEAKAYAAVQLFVERATASVDGFSLDDASAPAVSEICRRLDGIPLAIELADDMFAVLTQGRRFALPRHQTLRATLDWGYNLLSPIEQTVLRRIAIFRATFSLDSALAVVVGPSISVENAIDAMANLVAKTVQPPAPKPAPSGGASPGPRTGIGAVQKSAAPQRPGLPRPSGSYLTSRTWIGHNSVIPQFAFRRQTDCSRAYRRTF